MKTLIWIAAGVATAAIAWRMAPDIRRYIKISSM